MPCTPRLSSASTTGQTAVTTCGCRPCCQAQSLSSSNSANSRGFSLTYTDSASSSDRLGRPWLGARRIFKSFPGVLALRGVDLTCRAGSVHALIGGNGAGKSTLVSIITGIAQPDSGELFLDGVRFQPRSPREALKAGVVAVYQELAVLPNLSALD